MLLPLRKLPALSCVAVILLPLTGCLTHEQVHYTNDPKPIRLDRGEVMERPVSGAAPQDAVVDPDMMDPGMTAPL